jgi:TATA-binding protein-associated factor Taf7
MPIGVKGGCCRNEGVATEEGREEEEEEEEEDDENDENDEKEGKSKSFRRLWLLVTELTATGRGVGSGDGRKNVGN